MTFEPGHIIKHAEHGIGIVQKTDWRNTSVAFCAAADQIFDTRELRKSALVIDGPALVETHLPPDWDAPAEERAAWKPPISQPQFHPQDSHREILESFARVCCRLVLNSVGVFPKTTHFAGRYTPTLNPASVETAPPNAFRKITAPVADETYANILASDYPNKTHRRWKPKTGQKLTALIEDAGVKDLINQSASLPAAVLTYEDVAYSAVKRNPALQSDCKQLYGEWSNILNKIAQAFESDGQKYSRAHTFHTVPLRKDSLPAGACSRCGSELFFEENARLQCFDCGKYSAAPRKGKLPFQNERTQLAAILNSDDDTENLDARVEEFLSQPAGIGGTSSDEDSDPSTVQWGFQVSLGDLIFSKKGWGEFATNTQRPSSRRATLRATWLVNRERLFHVLAEKYPLVRDLDGRLRTSAAEMTEFTKAQYRAQMKSAGREIASVYWFAFCSMTDAEISKALSEYRSGLETVTPEQVKNIRESFIGRGNTVYAAPEPLPTSYKTKWLAFKRVLLDCPPYQLPALLRAESKTLTKHNERFRPVGRPRQYQYCDLQHRAPYALQQIKFGTCSCGRWKYLIPWNEELKCGKCVLAELEADAWRNHVSAKSAEPVGELVC